MFMKFSSYVAKLLKYAQFSIAFRDKMCNFAVQGVNFFVPIYNNV